MRPPALPAAGTNLPRLRSLDGLRGLAALVVVANHVMLLFPAFAVAQYDDSAAAEPGSWVWWLTYTPLHIVWEGTAAVYVFFVLSGLVLTLQSQKMGGLRLRSYYPARLIRLYVPVWAALGITVLTYLAIPRSSAFESAWVRSLPHELSPAALLSDSTLVFGVGGLDSPLWSLRWEVWFSLALPLFVWLAITLRKWNWAKIAACFAAVAIGGSLHLPAPLIYMPMFLVGAILAEQLPVLRELFDRWNTVRFAPFVWLTASAASILLLVSEWLIRGIGFPNVVADASIGLTLLGAAILVVIAIFGYPVGRPLERKAIQWVGRVSFSLYLVHEPILLAAAYLFGPDNEWLAILIALPAAATAAALLYRFVELPSHRLAKRVGASFDSRQQLDA